MQKRRFTRNSQGFTLLEIVIVLIIVGVLASVAMPTLFRNVERSRSAEAMAIMGIVKRATEGCSAQFNGNSATCNSWDALGMEDPSTADWNIALPAGLGPGPTLTLVARRTGTNGGSTDSTITITRQNTGVVTRSGTTAFLGIQ